MRIDQRPLGDFNPKSEIRNRKWRAAFTLVEVLVAIALIIFIMSILSWSFGRAMDTMRNLNGIANMQAKLIAAQMVMQRDLAAEKFGGKFKPGFSGPFVSDQRGDLIGWEPPDEGYFEVRQGSEGILEGVDPDGLWSTRAVDHTLRFTAKLSGRREEDWFYAYPDNAGLTLPAAWGDVNFNRGNGIATRWAEIAYFLVANGQNANGTPLYTLYRQQKAIQGLATTPAATPASRQLSQMGAAANGYNSTSTVTNPTNRGNLLPLSPATGAGQGNDILLTDVIAFEIKAVWNTGPASGGIASPRSGAGTYYGVVRPFNADWPFDVLPNITTAGWGRRFDTMSKLIAPATTTNWDDPSAAAPGFLQNNANMPRSRYCMRQLQIRLRIWDFNTQQSRQVTFVQDI